jgi:hypothetical protein
MNLHSHQHCISLTLPASSPTFVVACFLDDSHSDWGEMKSQCHFYFFGELFVHLPHLLIGVFVLLVFNFLNFLYLGY